MVVTLIRGSPIANIKPYILGLHTEWLVQSSIARFIYPRLLLFLSPFVGDFPDWMDRDPSVRVRSPPRVCGNVLGK